MKTIKLLKTQSLIVLTLVLCMQTANAQTYATLEAAQVYQSKNDQRVPGEGGDQFSIADFSKGPFFAGRLYVGHKWDERHDIRALYAPLALSLDSNLKNAIRFKDSVFAAGTATTAIYKFNSYRVTYAYHLEQKSDWKFAVGFTGKIRDAEVRLTQGALEESKSNVGFVPLAHFRGERLLSQNWTFNFDVDGLAAPQGRAIDLGLFLTKTLTNQNTKIFAGYRTLEGGADNDEVYNFSWFHFITVGLTHQFNN